jgi:hypothetical protein
MSKLNTVQNGKGDKPRVNLKNYWSSEYWDNLKKIKEQQKKVIKRD